MTRKPHFLLPLMILTLILKGQAPESQLRPPVTSADLRIVQRARKILDSPAKWNRADTRVCPAAAKTFSLYCALEKATDEVSGDFEHRGAAMQEARFVIDEVMAKGNHYDHRLMDYNNDPTTSFRDIQATLTILEDRIRKRLAEEPASYATASATSKPPTSPTAISPTEISPIDLEVAKRARAILDAPSKWNRADTQICPPNAQIFSLFCAYQMAAIQVQGAFDNGGAAIHEARAIVDDAPNRSKYQSRLRDYNNDPTVTFEDVRKLLLLVEQRMTKRLADEPQSNR
jgi:hypothetical protein